MKRKWTIIGVRVASEGNIIALPNKGLHPTSARTDECSGG